MSWQSDAELRKVQCSELTAEGTAAEASGWTYVFYSKRLRRSYEVSVVGSFTMGAESDSTQEIDALETLPKDYTDSDTALATSREAGFQRGRPVRMTLAKRADEPATWEVSTGNSAYLVNAESGKFLRVKE